MPDEPTPTNDMAEEASALPIAIIDRLAALDDRLAGHSSGPAVDASLGNDPSTADAGLDSPAINPAIDTMLLLRQVAAAERDSSSEPIVMPQRIGRYEIVREAGRGAFAYVLEARDEILRRRVALKVARPEALVSVPFRRRFIREAELAARLVHPHIVAIHEVGEEVGLIFIASEYCAGGDLAEWLEHHPGPMAPRQAAELVRTLATAVAHAHANGVVHRDIKPANVLLVPPPGPPGEVSRGGDVPINEMVAKVGDFGLGKVSADSSDENFTQLTRTGSRLGTPAWMAPEQIDRSFGDVGPATDIHALGLLLDRLLTGRCLFGEKTEAEIFRAVLLEDPAPADRVARLVPRDLAAVCLKCLAKRPASRYRSAADLAADLGRFLDDKPTLARPLSAASRVARALTRRPLFSLLAAAALAGLLMAGWATRERSREAIKNAAIRLESDRLEAATELRRGFEAWQTGNATAAVDHLRGCSTMDGQLAGSLAGRWLLARLHGEHDMLLAPVNPTPARPDLYCVACSRDGRVVAAGGADGRLLIRRLDADGVAAGPPLVIEAHDEINDVAISPDGLRVASAGEDGRLRLWNIADGSLVREAYQGPEPLFAAAFSPSGSLLACGGGQQRLCLISMDAAAKPRELEPFAAAIAAGSLRADSDIESLQFLGDDRIAMACGGMAAVLDVASGDVRMFPGHEGTVGQVALSRDGTKLLSAGTDREPRVWNLATGQLMLTLPRHPSWVQGCDFSPDGNAIATGCRDGVVRVFNATTGVQERQLVGHMGRTWDLKYDPAGMVVTAGADGTLRRWDLSADPAALGMREVRIPRLTDSNGRAQRQHCSVGIVEMASGKRAALLNLQDRTVVVDAATGAIRETASPSTSSSCSVAIDGSRHRFAAVPISGPIEVHPLPGTAAADQANQADDGTAAPAAGSSAVGPSATGFKQLPGMEKGSGKDAVWTPSGMLLAGCEGGRLLAWNASLDQVTVVDRLERTVDAVRLAPAGPARLAIAAGKLLRVYPLPASGPPDSRGGKTLVTLGAEAGLVVKLAWSPDGRQLGYGTSEGRVATIDAASGATIKTFPKHAREVVGIVWSPAGRTLITADSECVRVSDVATTMTFDELRPGWIIEAMDFVGAGDAGTSPLLVIAGSVPAAAGGTDRKARLGLFDLRHSLPLNEVQR
jgi:eukaryotic-like serine/threonine-protein kinase